MAECTIISTSARAAECGATRWGRTCGSSTFNEGHRLRARDTFGRRYRTEWDKLNFSALIQQGNFRHRGEQGLFESTGFKLFNLAGVEAPKTHYVQFRILDEEAEHGATQYEDDYWGLYLAIEQMDGRFLDEHDLPDGNLYKMEGGTGTLNNQGPTAVTDRSDLNTFLDTYEDTTPSDAWWRSNLDLERYYGYRTIVEGIHHYDIAGGKNYFYYLNPETNQWSVLPWDLDLTWANNMFGSGNEPFKSRVLSRNAFSLGYRNRARELIDLLWNPDQAFPIIDEFGAMVDKSGGARSAVDADRARWDYHPVLADDSIVNLSKGGHGRYYQEADSKDFEGMAEILRDYVVERRSWLQTNVLVDNAIPRRPTAEFTGTDGFPIDDLVFSCSSFDDPNGDGTFAAMRWRVGEVAGANLPTFDPERERPVEIVEVWTSGNLARFDAQVTVPPSALAIGSRYRLRVKMQDSTGRWSHWSTPVEFTAGAPTIPFPQEESLRITELMYHPAPDAPLEFVELQNVGDLPLDLSAVSFTNGIDFEFGTSDVTALDPGEFVLVVQDRVAFDAAYDTTDLLIAGEFNGSLRNSGERIALSFGRSTEIQNFVFDDGWYVETDGGGPSLIAVDPFDESAIWDDAVNWSASAEPGGSPGFSDGDIGELGGRRLPGDANADGRLDISDGLRLLLILFAGDAPLPCEGDLSPGGGNSIVLDVNADGSVNVTDAVYELQFLFVAGPPPVLGTSCVRVVGCSNDC